MKNTNRRGGRKNLTRLPKYNLNLIKCATYIRREMLLLDGGPPAQRQENVRGGEGMQSKKERPAKQRGNEINIEEAGPGFGKGNLVNTIARKEERYEYAAERRATSTHEQKLARTD